VNSFLAAVITGAVYHHIIVYFDGFAVGVA